MEPLPASAAPHRGSSHDTPGRAASLPALTRRLQGGRLRRQHTPRQCLARLMREALGGRRATKRADIGTGHIGATDRDGPCLRVWEDESWLLREESCTWVPADPASARNAARGYPTNPERPAYRRTARPAVLRCSARGRITTRRSRRRREPDLSCGRARRRRLTSVWSRRPLPPPRTADRVVVDWDGRRRSRQCHSRCIGFAAAPVPLPGAAHTRGVSQARRRWLSLT
jgi:hypothetical protein